MPFNKAKALQEAHKHVAQGKIARAIKQYEWIAEKDPSDLILLNVIGDLYAQENNTLEALKCFYKLADAYTQEGYKVKAIAIYKKISKIDRSTAEPLLRLAELQSAQGFAHEAREQYRNAFEFYEKAGQEKKALEILRKLCQLDPKSPGLRLDLAQFAERNGEKREAAGAYLDAAMLAQERGSAEAVDRALSKAAELAPENPEVHLFRARRALEEEKPEEVKGILDLVPELLNNPQARRLLLESYLAKSDLEAARGLLLDVFHSNPADFEPVAQFVARCIEKQLYDSSLEVLTSVAPELIERRDTAALMETLRSLWKSSPGRVDILEYVYQVAEKSADEATIPEVLEAMADAYVQRGQFEKAEQAYARLVAREPENETYKDLLRQVLEKQGKEYVPLSQTPFINSDVGLESDPGQAQSDSSTDAEEAAIVKGAITNSDFFARDGLTGRAVEELEKVLRVYPDQRDIHKRILEICREPLPKRAAEAAEVLCRIYSDQGESSEAERYDQEAQQLARGAGASPSASQDELSVQTDEVPQLSPRPVEINLSQAGESLGPEEAAELPPPQEISLQFQTPERPETATPGSLESGSGRPVELAAADPAQTVHTPEDVPPFDYEESREEIEFYLRHGFLDEARKAVSDLEQKYPVEGRVAEFRQRVDQLSRNSGRPEKEQPATGKATEKSKDLEWELPTSFSGIDESGGRDEAVETPPGELVSTLEDPDDPDAVPVATGAQSGQGTAKRTVADASAQLGSLLDELGDTNDSVDQPADDDETHYNLGVAFREMGLLDEAIGEFQKVVNGTGQKHSGPYFLQGCTLLASCFMEKEMPAIAARWYLRALDTPGLEHEGTLALYYDLGLALEKAGDTSAALEKFTEVYSQNIDFRDVAEKIRHLRQASR